VEIPVEQTDLRDYGFIEFTPLSTGHLADVPTFELRDVPGIELDRTSLLLNPGGLLRQGIQDSAHSRGSVRMVKLATQHGSFLRGAWGEPAGQPHGRTIAEVFDGGELLVVGLSFRPMAAINSTQVVDCHIRETAIVFPSDADRAIAPGEGLEELRRLQVNIGLRDQNRFVLHADNQIPVLVGGFPERIASLEDAVCNVHLKGLCVRVNSFRNEVIVGACLLGIVSVNIDLPKLAASADRTIAF
jgi:hypothetical protein